MSLKIVEWYQIMIVIDFYSLNIERELQTFIEILPLFHEI